MFLGADTDEQPHQPKLIGLVQIQVDKQLVGNCASEIISPMDQTKLAKTESSLVPWFELSQSRD
jgi:hypothetical protein